MKKYSNHEEIREVYLKGKFDIFYEDKAKKIKYEVAHIGSTIYCRNIEKCMGMGAITNFPIDGFYGIEKPEPLVVKDSSLEEALIEQSKERVYEE